MLNWGFPSSSSHTPSTVNQVQRFLCRPPPSPFQGPVGWHTFLKWPPWNVAFSAPDEIKEDVALTCGASPHPNCPDRLKRLLSGNLCYLSFPSRTKTRELRGQAASIISGETPLKSPSRTEESSSLWRTAEGLEMDRGVLGLHRMHRRKVRGQERDPEHSTVAVVCSSPAEC